MRLWKSISYVELIFNADDHLDSTTIAQPLNNAANDPSMPSRTPSVCSSSYSSTDLPQDPMHATEVEPSLRSTCTDASLSKSINSIALEDLKVSEVTTDEGGTQW